MWHWLLDKIPTSHLPGWYWWLTFFTIVLPIIGGLTGWAAWAFGDRISDLKDEADKQEDRQLNLQIAELNKGAEETKHARVDLEKQVEVLRNANLKLEAQIAPRHIEQNGPAQRLKKFSGVNAIIISASGAECVNLASQIRGMLALAEWNVPVPLITEKQVLNGLQLGPCSDGTGDTGKTKEAYEAIFDELNGVGIDASRDDLIAGKTTIKFTGVLIVIGDRPTALEAEIIKTERQLHRIEPTGDKILKGGEIDFLETQRLHKRLRELRDKLYKTDKPGVYIHNANAGWRLP